MQSPRAWVAKHLAAEVVRIATKLQEKCPTSAKVSGLLIEENIPQSSYSIMLLDHVTLDCSSIILLHEDARPCLQSYRFHFQSLHLMHWPTLILFHDILHICIHEVFVQLAIGLD